MKITVRTVDSASAELEVTGEMTVRQLKSEIYKKMSIAPSKQRLLFNGNCLNVSSNTLDQYSVGDGAELQLVLEIPQPDEKEGVLPQIPPEEDGEAVESGGAVGGEVDPQELEEQQRKEDEEHDKEAEEREKRNLKDIHKQVTNTKKCTEWAIKILDRYDRAEAKRLEWKRAREAGDDMAELDKEDDPDEKPEPRKRRFPWKDDDKETTLPQLERSEFVAMMTDIHAAQDRARPLIEHYQTLVSTDPSLPIEEGLQAERLAQTVKEFNYYIGHALISLSRLEMTMNNPPPRPVKLAPTRRSEMRRVMRDLRNMPPRAPSGYIVDIQRDGGPVPVGTRNAPAPTDPLTSVALGSKDKKKKKKDEEDKKDDGASGSGPATGAAAPPPPKGEGGAEGAVKPGEEPMEQEGGGGGGGGQKEGTEGGEPKKERTRDVLAKLLTGMVTGMVGSDEEEDDEEGEGEKKKKEEEMKKKKDKPKDSEDDEEDPKKTFAEKYVGPPGTVVTIQSIPQAQFGFLPMEPQPGPSLCIRNTGDPNNPDVKVNFPMPPALQMLQDLLGGDSSSEEEEVDKPESEMTEEEKEKKREREKKKEKKERRAREREVRRKKRQEEEKQKKEKESEMRRKGIETKAFTPREEEDPGELSDAGSIDSLDSQHDYLETHHIDNPMVRLALSAASEIEEGLRETVYDSMAEAYAHMGQPPPEEVAEEAGIMEMLFEALSKHLSVLETMALMWGVEEPMKKLQPCLYQFVKGRLLRGEDPTPQLKKAAVTKFLAPFIPSIASSMSTIFPKEGIDLPHTLYDSLYTCMEDAYDIIIRKHKDGAAFAKQLHQWATKTSQLSIALLYHTSRNDDLCEDAAKQLFTVFLPGATPAMAMGYPYASVTRELKKMKTAHKFTVEELDKLVVYRKHKGHKRTKPKEGGSGTGGDGASSGDSAPNQTRPQDPQSGGTSEEKQPHPPSSSSSSSQQQQQSAGDGDKMEEKELLSGSELMEKSMQSAIAESGATPSTGITVDAIVNAAKTSTGLTGELDKELHEGLRERLRSDPDFTPQQFPASDQVFQPSK